MAALQPTTSMSIDVQMAVQIGEQLDHFFHFELANASEP
jgi:hypothetical protein